jgi:hypothetical protein
MQRRVLSLLRLLTRQSPGKKEGQAAGDAGFKLQSSGVRKTARELCDFEFHLSEYSCPSAVEQLSPCSTCSKREGILGDFLFLRLEPKRRVIGG